MAPPNASKRADDSQQKQKRSKQLSSKCANDKALSDGDADSSSAAADSRKWQNHNEVDYKKSGGRSSLPDGINAPMLHRRLDAAIRRIEKLERDSKKKQQHPHKSVTEAKDSHNKFKLSIDEEMSIQDKVQYQSEVVGSLNMRMAKVESQVKRLTEDIEALTVAFQQAGAMKSSSQKILVKDTDEAKRNQSGASKSKRP